MRQAHSESRHVKLAIDGSAALDFTHTHTHTPSPASVLSFLPTRTALTHTHTHQTQQAFFPFPLYCPTRNEARVPLSPLVTFSATQQALSLSPIQAIQHEFLRQAFSPCRQPSQRSPLAPYRQPSKRYPLAPCRQCCRK